MPDSSGPSTPALRQRHPPTTTETVLSAAKQVEAKVEDALLVLWDELPHWRRDNAYIHTGYRATSNSYLRSFASLGYLHNESVNIWTHLLGAIGFTAGGLFLYSVVAPRYESASSADMRVFACYFAGAFLCLGMSATYHTLCNHSHEVARWGNKLDYTGIVFLILGSYVPALHYGLFCQPALLKMYMSMIFTLGLACLVVSWFDHFRTPDWRQWRALIFVGLGASGIVPVVHTVLADGYEAVNTRMGLNWVLLEGFFYVFGAFLYGIRWPERRSPGSFDIWGSSHQIFHVFVLLAAASHLVGMSKAFDYHHSVLGGQC